MSKQQQNYPSTGQTELVDLRSILTRYVYYWPLFILGLLTASAAAFAYLELTQPVHEISASILVKDEKKSPQEKSSISELEQSASSRNAETELEILRSKTLIRQVVDNLRLWVNYTQKEGLKTLSLYEYSPVNFDLTEPSGSLKNKNIKLVLDNAYSFKASFDGKTGTYNYNKPIQSSFGTWVLKPSRDLKQFIGAEITIRLDDQQNVVNDYEKILDAHLLDKLAPTISLTITDRVPARGIDFLNELISTYNNAAISEQKRTTKSTIDFIDQRLIALKIELNTAEKEVENYRSSQGLTDINSQAKVYLENVQTNDIKLNEVDVQLNVIKGIERYVNSPVNSGNAPSTIGITDPALNSMISKLSELQLQRSALLANTPEQNPIFEPINKQIALTKSAIKENVSSIKSSLSNSRRGLQSFNNKFESSIKDIPVQERQFVGMKRQQAIKENQYVYLLQKREELELSLASSFVDARIVDKATVGDVVWPRIPLIIVLVLLFGLGLPFLIIYLRAIIANKITTRQEIESALGISVLEELSFEDIDSETLVLDLKNHFIGEQFRSLRTNLNYLHKQSREASTLKKEEMSTSAFAGDWGEDILDETPGKGHVTLLTSSISKEGKSFVSTNLASSLAAAGRKSVLLEMDLRKPRVLHIFGIKEGHKGISEFLNGGISIEEIIQPSGRDLNLDIIGSGAIPDEPSELLGRSLLSELIDKLRKRYDNIIIDSPPVHLVTDAMIIAPLADVSLYVIRQGYTGKDELIFIREIYRSNKLPYLNIIFNGIKKSKFGYGYNYDKSYYNKAQKNTSLKSAWKKFLSRF
jgi:capsular exopolysaccharide synthesis family protein